MQLRDYIYRQTICLSPALFFAPSRQVLPTYLLPSDIMRRGLAIFLVVNLILLGLILNSVSTLISLLFEDCKADAIDPSEIPALNSTVNDTRPSYIPRIIHQTWQNESIPFKWQHAQKSCIDLHQDYEYKVCL